MSPASGMRGKYGVTYGKNNIKHPYRVTSWFFLTGIGTVVYIYEGRGHYV